MGYMHIDNLYRNNDILLFRECYALEKIHGTSANINFDRATGAVKFHSGGEDHERFSGLFDEESLLKTFIDDVGAECLTIYGEAHGGKQQGMSKTYGKELRFVVFDVKIDECWLSVPKAVDVCIKFGLEFVAFELVSTDVVALDAERDKPSIQAARNGVEDEPMREGVVLRPLIEVIKNNGARIIVKHKRPEFSERKTIPNVDPAKRELMERAGAIADEWVTPMRLSHVLDKLGNPSDMTAAGNVIKAMIEDVCREAEGEIADNNAVRKAIGGAAVKLYKAKIMKIGS